MLRRLAIGLFCAGALFAACGGGPTTLDVAKYDRSCTTASDCVAVSTDACCGCPNAAINAKDLSRYESDLATAHANCAQCTEKPCAALPPQCVAGMCTTGAPPLPDAGPDAANDAGVDGGTSDASADAPNQDGGADAAAD